MKFDKKQIALSVAGILAGLTLTYLLWRVEQKNSAAQQQADANAADIAESELANQQAEVASLPAVSVPTISSTPATNTQSTSPTDSSNQNQSPSTDSILEQIIAGFQSQDNSSVTNTSSPIGAITALPLPQTVNTPPVTVPSIMNFSQGTTPSQSQVNSPTFKHIDTSGS